jgi:hypothetical protein
VESVAKRKKIEKDKVIIRMGDGKSDVSFDGKGFLELYDAWKTKASDISAADLGMQASTDNLYAVLHKHGVMGRIMGNSGPENVPGIGKELDALEKMANNPQFTKEEIAELQQLVNILNTHGAELGDLNPRNIKFDGIGKINRRKRTASKKPVYGHYRTKQYVRFRTRYKDKQEIPAVSTEWYNKSKGVAKPPMWQAIYGDGTLAPFNGVVGLVGVVSKGIKTLNEAEHHITKDAPVKIERQGAAKLVYDGIKEVRDMMSIMIRDPDLTTGKGNFGTDAARRRLMAIPINVANNKESETVKRLLGARGTPGFVDDFYIYISRRQVAHMAKLAQWKPHPQSTYMKNKKPKEDEDIRTSVNRDVKDWRTIMKVMV